MERYEEIERSLIKTYRKGIWRKFIRAINTYKMMNEGDKIAVCISGGADSFVLAKCAQEIQRHGKFHFELCFLTADIGLAAENKNQIEQNAKLLNVPLVFFTPDEDLTDSLIKKAQSVGCNKIALGHHFDDTVEAILTNMLLGGKIATLMPKETRGAMEIIRPMCNVKRKDILAFARFNGIEFTEQPEENTEIKELVKRFRKTSQYIEMNIFNSVQDVNLTTVIAYHGRGREYNFLDDYDERGKING